MKFVATLRFFCTAIFSLVPLAVMADCATGSSGCLSNPTGYSSIMQFVENALRVFVLLALPVLAFFIVLAGFKFILARGNPGKLEAAKWNFFFVIIGTCLVLGAWVLASLIGATVTSITSS